MTIIGMNFNKISAEKNKPFSGQVSISNNVNVSDVGETKIGIGSDKKNDGLKFSFSFTVNYKNDKESNLATMVIEGDILSLEDEKTVKDVVKSWQDKRSIPKDILLPVLNTALNKCNIKALILSQDMNLPSPVPLPKATITPAATQAAAGKAKK